MAEGLTIGAGDAGQRLDRFLKNRYPMVPYGAIQKWLRRGEVRVNGKRAKADTRLSEGDVLRLPPQALKAPPKKNLHAYTLTQADREMFQAAILYEDSLMLVLNKPAGLAAQAGGGHTRSLDRIVAQMFPYKPPKLVHRLDLETTGLIVLAKNRTTAAALGAQFQGRTVKKEYLLVCMGSPAAAEGVVDAPLEKRGPLAVVGPLGDPAQTRWRVVQKWHENLHLVLAEPLTGRMNQIRVHMAHIGLPLVGDGKYGGAAAREAGRGLSTPNVLYLHSWKLHLTHPATGAQITFEAPPPAHFAMLSKR